MLLSCGVGKDPWVPWTARRYNQSILKETSLEYSLEGLMLICNSNTLATWCEKLTHLKRLWYWERLKAGRRRDDRGWDGWMASLTQWTGVWVSSGSWWWTGRPGVLQSMGSQRVGHDWATGLNWTELSVFYSIYHFFAPTSRLWRLWFSLLLLTLVILYLLIVIVLIGAKCYLIVVLFGFLKFLFQFSSVAQSCPTLCDPMNRSTPGLPVHH